MTFVRNLFRGNFWLEEIDNSQLILMRIILGLVIAADAFGGIATGWTYRAFVEPNFTFTFMGFEWLQVFVGKPMYAVYGIFGICGLLIALGAYYRIATIGAAVAWTMIYFAQKTNYNNHYYQNKFQENIYKLNYELYFCFVNLEHILQQCIHVPTFF